MEKMNFCGSLCSLLEYFLEEKLPWDRRCHLGWDIFTELFLSNIMKYEKNNIEWQISIQGMNLSDFGDYLRKREGTFKRYIYTCYTKLFVQLSMLRHAKAQPISQNKFLGFLSHPFNKLGLAVGMYTISKVSYCIGIIKLIPVSYRNDR